MLTLMEIADDPLVLTRRLSLRGGSEVLFRPLAHAGAAHLARFLEALSPEPRRLGAFDGYGSATPGSCVTRSRTTTSSDSCSKKCGPVFPSVTEVARRLGRTRIIILWGGVLSDIPRAIRYYEKNGFQPAGSFVGEDGVRSLDVILDLPAVPDRASPLPRRSGS